MSHTWARADCVCNHHSRCKASCTLSARIHPTSRPAVFPLTSRAEDRLLLSGATLDVDAGFTPRPPGWDVDHFAQIQAGINAAGAGDTVVVAAGDIQRAGSPQLRARRPDAARRGRRRHDH